MKKIVNICFFLGVFFFSGCVDSENNRKNSEIQKTQDLEITKVTTSVSPKEFKKFTSKITKNDVKNILLDVRTLPEFQSGHIKNAKMLDFNKADFRKKLSVLDKNKKYFIYCRSGSRSGRALNIMKEMGFTTVYNLKGGINNWIKNGFPIVY